MSINSGHLAELEPKLHQDQHPEGGDVSAIGSAWKLTLLSFLENKLAVVGFGIILLFVLFCFVGPLIYHTNQLTSNVDYANLPPGQHGFPLGSDDAGFDELGRIMYGGQASLEIGFFSALVATGIGTFVGTLAGLSGGWIDSVLMRFVDILLSIPLLFIVLILSTTFTPSVLSMTLVIGLFSWLIPARLVRGEVLSLKTRDFVSAARVFGASKFTLAVRHLVPNALGVVIVNITFQVADAIILVATLGFLGYGLHNPYADWGDMLETGTTYYQAGEWWLIYPVGICLVLLVMAWNFVGDAARDAVEVRLQRR